MTSIPQDWKIERAQESHISAIAAIADYYNINRLVHEERASRGFLVSSYSEATYRKFLTRCDHFYVALDQDSVIGFLLAFSRDKIPVSDWVGMELKRRESKPFILSKQVAIRADFAGRGVAAYMYRYLFKRCPNVPIIGAIVLDPPNQRSVRFHESLGFEKFWETTPPDGIARGVWRRVPNTEAVL